MKNHMSAQGRSATGGKYFFIFGTNPTLSLAEISAIYKEAELGVFQAGNVFVFESEKEINAKEVIRKIGGTVKIGVIEDKTATDSKKIAAALTKIIKLENISGKFNFGISNYGVKKINIKIIGMETKKYLREHNISCRWVTSQEPVLSSVVVEQNKLVANGLEIVLFKNGANILIGRTLAVQPFKELSFRDYGRPARDDYSGMLPPKLAEIMINLAKPPLSPLSGGQEKIAPLIKGGRGDFYKILDPFCGSGTILTEAALMGYNNLFGSDISEKAVSDTEKNMEWTRNKFSIFPAAAGSRQGGGNFQFSIKKINVIELSKFHRVNSIDAIITEPYLGPQRGKVELAKIKKELEKLYSESLAEFYKILKPGGRVVMVWPIFLATQERISLNLSGFKIVNPIPEKLRTDKNIMLTDRGTIIYGREGQKVWREIVVLEK